MAGRKYKQYFNDMIEAHKELFDAFSEIHEKYVADPKKFQEAFNEKGDEVMTIIRRYENMLCNTSEGSKFGKFSSNLAEKFRDEVRTHFSKIDFIGMN